MIFAPDFLQRGQARLGRPEIRLLQAVRRRKWQINLYQIHKIYEAHFIGQKHFCLVLPVQMWYRFASVRLTDAAILQPDRSWIRAVVESGLNPIATQNVIPILSPFTAYQLGYGHSIGAIKSFKPQEDTVGCVINAEFDALEGDLSQGDYASKRVCNCRVQSRIPL